MKNSAVNYLNANRENANAKRREESVKDKLEKKACSKVKTILKLAKQEPDCVCVVCNRFFYPRSIAEFKCDKYKLDLTNIIHPVALNSADYICKTCHSS